LRIRLSHRGLLIAAALLGACAAGAYGEDAAGSGAAGGGGEAASRSIAAPSSEGRVLGMGPRRAAAEGPRTAPGGVSGLSTILPLAGVLSLAIAGGAVIRALSRRGGLRGALGAGGRAPSGILEVIGRYPICRGCTLVLLKVDRRLLLLSQSSAGRLGLGAAFTTLAELAHPEEVASILVKARDDQGESMAGRFRGMLTRFDQGYSGESETGGRRARASAGGDRLEVWDDSRHAIPVVDLTQGEGGAVSALRRRLAGLAGGGRG
jgi:hypothetical protein